LNVIDADARVAVVTGAARPWGVGRAAALALADKGYDIAIVDRRADWGRPGADEIAAQSGRRTVFVETDISDRDQVDRMMERILREFGRADVLINCAAVGSAGSAERFTDDDFRRVIGVNLLGTMLCTQAVVPAMRARRYGRIVNVASSAPFKPPRVELGSVALYNASKAGVIGWTKSAAVELAPFGIVANVVAVGGLSTAMGSEGPPSAADDAHMLNVVHAGALPWVRPMTASEAGAILAMVADAPNHALLGSTIHASGGRVMPL
jgi:3-oxoacyl-[acyl-carrier protein] reductase